LRLGGIGKQVGKQSRLPKVHNRRVRNGSQQVMRETLCLTLNQMGQRKKMRESRLLWSKTGIHLCLFIQL
jgi:hypothetical protein